MREFSDCIEIISVEAAAAEINSGDTIWAGSASSISVAFLNALSKRQHELKNITILVFKGNNPCALLDELKNKSSFKVLSFYEEAFVNTYNNGDKFKLLKSSAASAIEAVCIQFEVNTIAVAVCPPDRDGNCNVGESGSYLTPAIHRFNGITKRIAIIDKNLLAATGNKSKSTIRITEFDYICPNDSIQSVAPISSSCSM